MIMQSATNIPMKKTYQSFILLLCGGALLLLSGCVTSRPQQNSPDYYLALSRDEIYAEIITLEEKLAQEDSPLEESAEAETAYHLALLYSHFNNPAPDYARAAALLDDYTTETPPGPEKYRLLHTLDLLHTINNFQVTESKCLQLSEEKGILEADKKYLETDNASLKKQCAEMKRSVDRIKKENKKMKNSIEQLKMLDLRIEEKRRAIQ